MEMMILISIPGHCYIFNLIYSVNIDKIELHISWDRTQGYYPWFAVLRGSFERKIALSQILFMLGPKVMLLWSTSRLAFLAI